MFPIVPGTGRQHDTGISPFAAGRLVQSVELYNPQHSYWNSIKAIRFCSKNKIWRSHILLNIVPQNDNVALRFRSFQIVLHCSSQCCLDQAESPVPKHVTTDAGRHLENEHKHHQNGKGQNHAVVLLDRSIATEKRDYEDDNADRDEEGRDREELIIQEVGVAMEDTLHCCSDRQEHYSSYL